MNKFDLMVLRIIPLIKITTIIEPLTINQLI